MICGHHHPTKKAAMQCRRRHATRFAKTGDSRRYTDGFEVVLVKEMPDTTRIPGGLIVSGPHAGKEI